MKTHVAILGSFLLFSIVSARPSIDSRVPYVDKHVSVHLPERRVHALDHFNPSQHHYIAENSVQIFRKTTALPDYSDLQPAAQELHFVTVLPPTQKPERYLTLDKDVSVHLPEHRVSSLDHFNPKQHTYEAKHSVHIKRKLP